MYNTAVACCPKSAPLNTHYGAPPTSPSQRRMPDRQFIGATEILYCKYITRGAARPASPAFAYLLVPRKNGPNFAVTSRIFWQKRSPVPKGWWIGKRAAYAFLVSGHLTSSARVSLGDRSFNFSRQSSRAWFPPFVLLPSTPAPHVVGNNLIFFFKAAFSSAALSAFRLAAAFSAASLALSRLASHALLLNFFSSAASCACSSSSSLMRRLVPAT